MKDRDRDIAKDPAPDQVPAESPTPLKESTFPWKVAGGGIVALLLIWFIVQNAHTVRVNLFWWSGAYPMILVMAAVAIASILVWETLNLLRRRRKKKRDTQT
ncbi:MAG: hypothetical protein OXC98_00345 [bacterium]|nr:DUF1049 domain-containing protein [Acidimicrobiia bacterium]MCY4648809.1 hypothetical protein [bacterium]